MDRDYAHAFRLKVQKDAELRQKLKDIDLLPRDMQAVAVVFIARDEGFTLGALDTEEVLASLTPAGVSRERHAL
jgi:hypothetical protein